MSDDEVVAVIAARNEAAQIADAIRSAASLATRVIVIDDFSTDETAEYARRAGAWVVQAQPEASGNVERLFKQGFSLVRHGWILRMDADERVTDDLARSLRSFISTGEVSAVRFARLNVLFGGAVRHGGWLEARQGGLFRADSWDRSWGNTIHQQVAVVGPVATITPRDGVMIHLDYDEVSEFVERSLMRYARQEAQERYAMGRRFKVWRLLLRPFLRTVWKLTVRGGVLDGSRGLVVASLLGFYDGLIEMYLWEMGRSNDESSKSKT